jgi:hypothetical protein
MEITPEMDEKKVEAQIKGAQKLEKLIIKSVRKGQKVKKKIAKKYNITYKKYLSFEQELKGDLSKTEFHIILKESYKGELIVEAKTIPQLSLKDLNKQIKSSKAYEAGVGLLGVAHERLGFIMGGEEGKIDEK